MPMEMAISPMPIYDQNRTIDGDTVTWTGVDFPDGAVFALIFIRDNENPNIIISTNKSSAARDEIVEFTVALSRVTKCHCQT